MEIERKYLVKQLPENLGKYPHFVIEQGYLCTEPTIRIRRKNNDYILTYKSRQNVSPRSTPVSMSKRNFRFPKRLMNI